MKIGIANDHGGYQLKVKLMNYLIKKGHIVEDLGCPSTTSVDYPIYAFELGEKLVSGDFERGIAICKSGIGISIACNKVKGIRCSKPANEKEARLSREHNDANVLALSADMPYYRILDIVDTFLTTNFSNEDRHQRRIDEIHTYETKRQGIKRKKEKEDLEEIKETIEDKKDEC